jgi:hypothetical protein
MAISLRIFAGNVGYKRGGSFAEESIIKSPLLTSLMTKARRNFLRMIADGCLRQCQ